MCHHHLFARLLLYQKHAQVALRAKEKHEKFAYILKLCIISSWMHFNRVTNKEHRHSLVVSSFFAYTHALELHVPFLRGILVCALSINLQHCETWLLIVQAIFPTPALPLTTVYSVWWMPVSLPYVGAHGWVAGIYWPWGWLPIVDTPGCFRHPTST